MTDWQVLGRGDGLAWLECRPRTGRTHQVRVHCASLGCPVLGDPIYGAKEVPMPPMHLHARAIAVPLYAGREPIAVEAAPPEHMRNALRACGWVAAGAGDRT